MTSTNKSPLDHASGAVVSPDGTLVSKIIEKRKYNYWTSATLLRLRKCYPTMPPEKLLLEFAPHSLNAIQKMASQLQIYKRRQNRHWAAIAAAYKPVIFAPRIRTALLI